MKKLECKGLCCSSIEENPVMILNSIARLFDARARASGIFPDSLPHSSRRLMRILAKCEGVSMIDLVEYTHLSKPTVSLGLKKMEEMGLVKKESDPSDARISKIYLTEKGKELFNVVAVADLIEVRREKAKEAFGCDVYEDYRAFYVNFL